MTLVLKFGDSNSVNFAQTFLPYFYEKSLYFKNLINRQFPRCFRNVHLVLRLTKRKKSDILHNRYQSQDVWRGGVPGCRYQI